MDVKLLLILLLIGGGSVVVCYYAYTTYYTKESDTQIENELPSAGNDKTMNNDSGILTITESGYYKIQIPEFGEVGVFFADATYQHGSNPEWSGRFGVLKHSGGDYLFSGLVFVTDKCEELEKKIGLEPINFELLEVKFVEEFFDTEEEQNYEIEDLKKFEEDLKKTDGAVCVMGFRFDFTNKDTGETFRKGDVLKFNIYWAGKKLFKVEIPIEIRFVG